VFRSPAETAARHVRGALAGAALLALALAFPLDAQAQDLPLQAERDGRLYVLAGEGRGASHWAVLEPGGRSIAVPADGSARFESLQALESGWLLAGDRAREKGRGRELALWRGGENGVETLPVPPAGSLTVRDLEPLVERGRLVGIAWLEGDDPGSLGVRAAAWAGDGRGFEPAEWVSPPTGSSQLALSGAVLDDGGWLLVWSSFDGVDDEILWSRREGSTWTSPARLNAANRVPDITPVVTAADGGAVCAWSQYDQGNYRVHVSRWRGASWSSEERVGGPGTVFPYFVAEEGRAPALIYRDASAGAWSLVELGSGPRRMVRSTLSGAGDRRPLVRRGASGSWTLEWLQTAPPASVGGP
jgi:hypothetical protein